MSYALELIRLTLIEALRSRLAWVAVAIILIAFGLAGFLAQVALLESEQIQIAIIAALLRGSGVFLLVTFVIASMAREANDKVTELLISQPVPRWVYLTGRFSGYAAVAVILAAAFAAPLVILAPSKGTILWGASLGCELLIMSAVSLFCALTLSQVLPSFAAAAGLYLLARSIETIRAIAASPLAPHHGWTDSLARSAVDVVAIAVPALDRFSLTRWLYEAPPAFGEIGDVAVQTAVYLALIGAAALFDLYRRNY